MSEKPFERLLIEIGTDTGDLSKTIKDLEKLEKFIRVGTKKGDATGLWDTIKDAVRDALKPAKGMVGGGGGGFTPEMFDKLDEFRKEFLRMTKDVKNLFGPGRNPANIGVEKLVSESGMGAGSLLKFFIDDKERNASIQAIAQVDERKTRVKQDENTIRNEADAGLFKYFSYAHTPMGKTTGVYKDMTALIAKTPWKELPTSVAINRAARAIFEDRSEQHMMGQWKSALEEHGVQIRAETPLRTVNEEALTALFNNPTEYAKFKPVLDELKLIPGTDMPNAIPQMFKHQSAEGLPFGVGQHVFDPKKIKDALLGQKGKKGAGYGATEDLLRSLVVEGEVANEGLARIDALIVPGTEEKIIEGILATTGVPEGNKITKDMQREWLEKNVRENTNLPLIEGKKDYMRSKTGQDVYKRMAQDEGVPVMLVASTVSEASQDVALATNGMAFTLPGKQKFREIFGGNIDEMRKALHENPEVFGMLDKMSFQDWEDSNEWRDAVQRLKDIYDKVTGIADNAYSDAIGDEGKFEADDEDEL